MNYREAIDIKDAEIMRLYKTVDARDETIKNLNKQIKELVLHIDGQADVIFSKQAELDKSKDLIKRMHEWVNETTMAHYTMGIGTVEQRTTTAQNLMFEAEAMTKEA
jgi:uncharacterized protein (DUF3084 family)